MRRLSLLWQEDGDMSAENEMTWDEFREAGGLWWVNRVLHMVGMAIYVEVDEAGKVTRVYPGKCEFRGFGEDSEERGFRRMRTWLHKNAADLVKRLDTE